MKLKKIYRGILRFIANYFLFNAVNVLCKTLRIRYSNREAVEKLTGENKNFVLAFWHGTMLPPWYLHRKMNMAALISKSKDGNLLARVLKAWEYDVVRGSSTEGGNVALGVMVDYAKARQSVAVTPDGPRGPVHKLKPGAVIAAKRSGIPLILLGIGIKRKHILRSWDSFEIPALFTRVNAVYSDPVYIDKDIDYDKTSAIIEQCNIKLNELQKKAQEFK